jgi:hypothetical protein
MANALYAKGKQRTLNALINWETSDVRAALVNTAYTQNLTADEFQSAISANIVGTPVALANKSVVNGIFDADDIVFPTVAAGSTCKCVVLYLHTGNPSTSPLLGFIDTITGFPLATSGGDVLIQWDNGPFKIFSL